MFVLLDIFLSKITLERKQYKTNYFQKSREVVSGEMTEWLRALALMDQPDSILRLKVMLLQGQNQSIPLFCKIWV